MCAAVTLSGTAPASAPYTGTLPTGVVDGGDALYGTTLSGGPNCAIGADSQAFRWSCGVLYRLSYDGKDFRILHAFDQNEGGMLQLAPILGPDGVLYGTAAGLRGESVIYSVHRDGSNFSILYRYPTKAVWVPEARMPTAVAVTARGRIYAAILGAAPDRNVPNLAVLATIENGSATIVRDFGANAAIVDLKSDGTTVYALVQYETNDARPASIYAVDESGAVRQIASAASLGYVAIDAIALSGTTLYAAARATVKKPGADGIGQLDGAILRINSDGSPTPLRTFDPPDISNGFDTMGGLVPVLASAPNGGVIGATAATAQLNCGTIFRIDASGRYTLLASLPPDSGTNRGPCFRTDPIGPFLATAPVISQDGSVYVGTEPLQVFCNAANCGYVVCAGKTGMNVLHAFAAPPTPIPATPAPEETPQLKYAVRPIGFDRFELTLKVGDVDHEVSATPSMQPISITSVATKKAIPLRLAGRGDLSLVYESPRVAAGFYDVSFGYGDFYLPQAPNKPPALTPGQQFVAFEGLIQHPATDAGGQSFGPWPVTLVAVTPTTMRFRTIDGSTFSTPVARSASDVPGMLPVVNDPAVETVRAKYLGRTVYTTPSFQGLANGGGSSGGLSQSLRVAGVYRVYDYVAWVSLDGSYLDADGLGAVDPIVITFTECPNHFAPISGHCDVLYTQAFDPWHVERILSLHPLVNPSWPARLRNAIRRGEPIPGMTYDMVAAVLGYPTTPGTIAYLKTLSTWTYNWPPPFGATVHFSHGVVTKYDPPARMP